ncbi:MAG TPA: hypothetical protein VJ944_04545 [Thermoplasmataceae archaeon]|nr:hypothetical protein [Thermoplasmataceae archaeon]
MYNANENVISSTVTSPVYSFLLVFGIYVFSTDLSIRLEKQRPSALKIVILSGVAVSIVSLPLLIYYDFYYSYSTVISGSQYTIYPYAVQPGMPFLLGLFIAFIAWSQMFVRWARKRGIGVRARRFVRTSKYSVKIPFRDKDGNHDDK